MRVTKAVITAAKPNERLLPLQLLVDRDDVQKPALRILVDEALSAGIQEVCFVIHPGDRTSYEEALGRERPRTRFVEQSEPLGYGDALLQAREFVGDEHFLHFVSDHVYVASGQESCARQVVNIAQAHGATVSAVQETHQRRLDRYGVVRGSARQSGSQKLYDVEEICEKPDLETARSRLVTEGLSDEHFLCFLGMHVLPPEVMEILTRLTSDHSSDESTHPLTTALNELVQHSTYLAIEPNGVRCNMGVELGLLKTQIALVHAGANAKRVLTEVLGVLIEGMHD